MFNDIAVCIYEFGQWERKPRNLGSGSAEGLPPPSENTFRRHCREALIFRVTLTVRRAPDSQGGLLMLSEGLCYSEGPWPLMLRKSLMIRGPLIIREPLIFRGPMTVGRAPDSQRGNDDQRAPDHQRGPDIQKGQ